MTDKNRKHKRIEKKISMRFRIAGVFPDKWDMSTIENISAGGIKFAASSDLKLKDKIIQLEIRIPELAPVVLELEALVVSVNPRFTEKYCDVRVKFINLSEKNKGHLSILEKIIERHEVKYGKKNI